MTSTTIHLKAMTWDHTRGYDPMVVTSNIFCEKNPGVDIQWHKRSLQAFADRPLEKMAEDYDLMVIDHPHVGEAAASGLLAPFDGQGLDRQLSHLEQESLGASYNSYNFDDRQWALPIDAAAPIAAFRPDLLDKAPASWHEVIALAEKGQLIWPLKPINALMSYFNILANLGEPFGVGGVGVKSDTSIEVLDSMLAACRHIPLSDFVMDPIDGYELLSARSSRSYLLYAYGYSNYSRFGFRPYLVKAANIPALGDNGAIGSTIGGTGLAISSQCKDYQIASEYASWVASALCQKGAYFDFGGQPANRLAWEDDRCNAMTHNFFRGTMETLENAYLRPRHKGYVSFQDQAGNIVRDCLLEKITPAQVSDSINAAYHSSLPQ